MQIYENAANIVVFLILVLVVGLAIRKIVRDKKAGRSSCGCDCKGCGAGCRDKNT